MKPVDMARAIGFAPCVNESGACQVHESPFDEAVLCERVSESVEDAFLGASVLAAGLRDLVDVLCDESNQARYDERRGYVGAKSVRAVWVGEQIAEVLFRFEAN